MSHRVLIHFTTVSHTFVNIRRIFHMLQIVAIVAAIILIRRVTRLNEELELSLMRPI